MKTNALKKGVFLALSSLFVLYGCSLPKLIVLDDPLTPEEHIRLGAAYERGGEFDPAIKEYELAAPKLPLAYLCIGNVYFHKKELAEAEKYYKKAIEQDPDNADVHNNLAWLYYTKRENLDEAKRLVMKAMELNPSKNYIYGDTLEKIETLKKDN